MSSVKQENQPPADAGGTGALPLFYREPVVLRAEEHRTKVLAPFDGFGFAAGTNAVPLMMDEFMPAVRHYPIVFAGGDNPIPLAVTGLKQGQNLFLEENGDWRANTYVPAYLRRYPFIETETTDGKFRFLSVDTASGRFMDMSDAWGADHERLFEEDGTPAEFTRKMMRFCRDVHEAHLRSGEFTSTVRDFDLFVTRQAEMSFPDKSRYRLRGFEVIDPERYRALPPQIVKGWQRKGWLDAIALHLASQRNWSLLMELENKAGRAA